MPVVAIRNKRKYRGLARSRIFLCRDAINRILNYDSKHPQFAILDEAGDNAAVVLLTQLSLALNAVIPR